MKKIAIYLLSLIIVFSLYSFRGRKKTIKGTGNTKQMKMAYQDFKDLTFLGDFQVYITQADKHKIVITYDDVYNEKLDVSKKDKMVTFNVKGNNRYKNARLEVRVYMPFIDKIKTEGNNNFNITYFKTENINFDLEGKTTIYTTLEVKDKMTIKTEGKFAIFLEGFTNFIEITSDGNFKMKARKFAINDRSVINTKGYANMEIQANSNILLISSGNTTIGNYGKGNLKLGGTSGVFRYSINED